METKANDIIIHDVQKGYLTLPFDEDHFKEFVASLLGQPQTISKLIVGKFEIHLKDLQNFHDLIEQRIAQQNNGKLLQLKTQIFFSDRSSVLLSSYNELITYNEVKPIISKHIILTWTYLIQFSDKSVPEKQEIELKISTRNKLTVERREIFVDEILAAFEQPVGSGAIELNIRHTARSWGNDIEALLTNQINSILLKTGGIKSFVAKYNGQTILFLTGCLTAIICYAVMIRNRYYINSSVASIQSVLADGNTNKKLNYLINRATIDQSDFLSSAPIFIYTIIFVLSLIISVIFVGSANFREKSFIVLTRESLKYRDSTKKKEERVVFRFVISYILSIVASLIASYIFVMLSKK